MDLSADMLRNIGGQALNVTNRLTTAPIPAVHHVIRRVEPDQSLRFHHRQDPPLSRGPVQELVFNKSRPLAQCRHTDVCILCLLWPDSVVLSSWEEPAVSSGPYHMAFPRPVRFRHGQESLPQEAQNAQKAPGLILPWSVCTSTPGAHPCRSVSIRGSMPFSSGRFLIRREAVETAAALSVPRTPA